MSDTPVFLITGASSGFGKAIALEALQRGYKVIATARSASKLSALQEAGAAVLDLDVAAHEDVLEATFKKAHDIYGSLTHVVNAAGYVLEGAVEEASQAEIAAQFATNVFGAAGTTRAAAPFLREAAAAGRQTALASFGSLASWTSFPAVALYSASKAAVSLLMEGVAKELKPFGIDVTAIEPGYFRTGLLNTGTGSSHKTVTKRVLKEYEGTEAAAMRNLLVAADNNQPGDVDKGARVIVDVLTRTGVAQGRAAPPRLVLGSDCVQTIRQVIADTEKILEEWGSVALSTDRDE